MSTQSPPTRKTAQKVFISYRRQETAAHAGRLYDAMVTRFGERNVFMDVGSMAPGVDFVEQITEVVSGCLVLVALIGPEWSGCEDEHGERRLFSEGDFVRQEIAIALRDPNTVVVPALVGGARMPRAEELPPDLRQLARRNALELSEGRWGYDVGRLFAALDQVMPDDTRAEVELNPQPLPPEPPEPLSWRLVPEGVVVAAAATSAMRLLAGAIFPKPEDSADTAAQVMNIVLRQATTGMVTGAALALWLAYRLGNGGGLPWLRGLIVGALAGTLGGLVLGLLTFLPAENLHADERRKVALLAVPVTGALLGSLIGSLWRPRQILAALLGGAAGGLLFQLVSNVIELNNKDEGWIVFSFGLAAAFIAGAALVTMLVVERSQAARSRAG